MKIKTLQGMSSLLLVIALTLSVVQPGLAQEAPASPDAAGGAVYDPLTGALAFVGTKPGKATESLLSNPSAASPAMNAAAFMAGYSGKMGLRNVSADLILSKTSIKPGGRSTVRYQQRYQGIPVFGSQVIVNTDARGAMLSLSAKTSPNLQVDINPTLTAESAAAAAVQAISKYNHLDAGSLTTSTPKLQIYDSRLLNPDGAPARLVWNVVVSALNDGVSEVVLVDARNAAIALHYNQVDSVSSTSNGAASTSEIAPVAHSEISTTVLGVPQIGVYNLNNTAPAFGGSEWPGTFVCDQSTCGSVGGDATGAYLNALDAYNFMKNYIGIDSIDNAGAAINATINYSNNYKKVFWLTGLHTAVYGTGYTGSDDMAGHAIGFGLLENSGASALILAYQPGAIAESLTDTWGELIDQTNGRGTDTTAAKWIIGEDWPDGQQRSMKDPTAAPFFHPDKMTSPYYYLGDDNSTGIYKNAGVNSKAVSLMTDGGTFNGKTITGLGILKVAKIYYEAETNLLGPASTYFDLYYAVKQACYNLINSNITAQDCDQVRNALDAVEMNVTSSAIDYPVADYCPPGQSKGDPTAFFFDSLENGVANWTITNPSSPSDLWTPVLGISSNGLYHFEGPEPAYASQSIAETTNAILIPSSPVYLFFEHWFNFDAIGEIPHDGGFLLYSTNNGATWNHTAPLYASGQNYNGTLASGLGNPWEGNLAFVSYVRNYVSTSFNLSSLAGQTVKFRWIVASDDSTSGSGWYVDNIQVYRCVSVPGIPTLLSPASNALQTNFQPTLRWSNATPNLDHYIVQIATDTTFASPVYEAVSTTSTHVVSAALSPNKKYYWRVRAYNAANDAQNWSAVRYFRTALGPPILQSPIGSGKLKPIFNWKDVAAAKGYTIQVSLSANFKNPIINVTISKPTSLYKSTKALVRGKKYYWRVRTNGVNGPSAWTAQTFVAH